MTFVSAYSLFYLFFFVSSGNAWIESSTWTRNRQFRPATKRIIDLPSSLFTTQVALCSLPSDAENELQTSSTPSSRRAFLALMAGTTTTLLSNTSAQAAEKQSDKEDAELKQQVADDDPWASFSEEISKQQDVVNSRKWPLSNSPLPPPAHAEDGQFQATDMQEALNRVKNKRQIDPRTHG